MKCENCGGKGTVGFLKRKCVVCDGSGDVEVKKSGRQPYTGTSYSNSDAFFYGGGSDSSSSDNSCSDSSSSSDSGSSDSGGGCGD